MNDFLIKHLRRRVSTHMARVPPHETVIVLLLLHQLQFIIVQPPLDNRDPTSGDWCFSEAAVCLGQLRVIPDVLVITVIDYKYLWERRYTLYFQYYARRRISIATPHRELLEMIMKHLRHSVPILYVRKYLTAEHWLQELVSSTIWASVIHIKRNSTYKLAATEWAIVMDV